MKSYFYLAFILVVLLPGRAAAQVKSNPNWTVNPNQYQYNATVTASLRYNNLPAPTGQNVLAAFAGTEVRGVATPLQFGDDRLFFLTVYTNSSSEQITFKVYYPSIDSVLTVTETLTIIPNGVYGSVASPYIFHTFYRFDYPPVVSGIPDQNVPQGTAFNAFDLDNFLTRQDNDSVVWSSRNAVNLNVAVSAQNVVTVTPLNPNWKGTETIIFRATDATPAALYGEDTVRFTIRPTDHAPRINSLPGQTIGFHSQFANVNLKDYLIETDGDSTQWTYSFPSISGSDPVPGWSVNPGSFVSSMTITAEVFSRGAASQGNSNLLAAYSGGQLRGVTQGIIFGSKILYFLTVYSNTNGDSISFRFYDGVQHKQLPVYQKIQFSANGSAGSPSVPFRIDAGNLLVNINSAAIASFTIVDTSWIGSESIRFKVQDTGTANLYWDTATVVYKVINDHTPVLSGIPNQTIQQGQSFSVFKLDNFLTEVDGDSVQFSYSGNSHLSVILSSSRDVTVTANDTAWTGTEKIIFRVTDKTVSALFSLDTVQFTITRRDHAPRLAAIPAQLTGYGGSFNPLNLFAYLTETDGDSVTWSYAVQPPAVTDPAPQWSVVPSLFGQSMTLTGEVYFSGVPKTGTNHILAAFVGNEVRGTASPFYFGGKWLYFMTIYSNLAKEKVKFKFYDAAMQKIYPAGETLTFSSNGSVGSPSAPFALHAGNVQLTLTGAMVTAAVTDSTWAGSETVRFYVTDGNTTGHLRDSVNVVFTVAGTSIPVVSAPSALTAVTSAMPVKVVLHWTDNSNNETGFKIERKNGDSLAANPFVVIDSVGAGITSYTDTLITDSTMYSYRLTAYNTQIRSAYSNQSAVLSAPMAPELTLTVLLEGLYNASADTMRRDTISVLLKSASAPYTKIDSIKVYLDNKGSAKCYFPGGYKNGTYYIVIKHRSSVETWSALSKSFSSGRLNVNFTTDSTLAFGSNLKKKGSRFCLYAGDVNQDGVVDITDLRLVDNDSYQYRTGYRATDIDGNLIVDFSDLILIDNNAAKFIISRHP